MNKEDLAARIGELHGKVTELQIELRNLYLELNSDVVNECVSDLYKS